MTESIENLIKRASKGVPYGGEKKSAKNVNIKLDKPMLLKHSNDNHIGKPMVFNEGVNFEDND